jgi:hypothetical protein
MAAARGGLVRKQNSSKRGRAGWGSSKLPSKIGAAPKRQRLRNCKPLKAPHTNNNQ